MITSPSLVFIITPWSSRTMSFNISPFLFILNTFNSSHWWILGISPVVMTPEMVERAQENAIKGGYKNVEFRLGEIDALPVPDNSIDVVISNCVINLAPDKRAVFKEAFRVLKAGGRLMISDIVLSKKLPDVIKNSIEAYVGCISGAIKKDEYIDAIKNAGFNNIGTIDENSFPIEFFAHDPTADTIIKNLKLQPEELKEIVGSVISIKVYGIKPD